jgi:hypothetical protein
MKVNRDFGSIFSTMLPGTKAKIEPPAGQSVLDGLEMRVAFGGVWKDSLSELRCGVGACGSVADSASLAVVDSARCLRCRSFLHCFSSSRRPCTFWTRSMPRSTSRTPRYAQTS